MVIAWLLLWLGGALVGLACLVAAVWYRQRRFQSGLLALPLAALLAAVGAQELIAATAAFADRRTRDLGVFVGATVAAAALAVLLVASALSRRTRATVREGAARPRRVRGLEALAAVARLSSEGGTVEEVGGSILDAACPVVGADACVLLLYDPDRHILQGKAASGMPDDDWRTFDVPVSDGFNQRLLERGPPILVTDVEGEQKLKMTLARKIGARSALVVPLRYEDRPIGTLTFYALREPKSFDDISIELAELIANEAADVLERARLREELLEERERAARVLAHVGDGVFVADGETIVRLWNPAAAEITGLEPGQVVGRRLEEALPGWAQIAAHVPVSTAPADAARHFETLPLELVGREVWLSLAGVEFADGTVYAFRDVTEEHGLSKLKTDFIATVSHELRTPLAAVYGAAMTLLRTDVDWEDGRRDRLLGVIANESERLARIVNEVLAASRIEAGTFLPVLESCDGGALADLVVQATRAHLPSEIELELVVEPVLPPVAADPEMTRQVLTNLVENAVKYSPTGGTVHVSLARQKERVLFAVRDEGLGIPPREQERIFEKFYRLDPQLTRGVGGTGLGLYICRELVRRMNGRIWVASREGEGSTFFFELPLATERLAPAAAGVAAPVVETAQPGL